MTLALVRVALETALAAISPSLATAWENVPYTPVVGTPYQSVFLMTAEPEHPEMGRSYLERGYLQVNLNYPLDTGPAAATARAELIRAKFPRGVSFVSGGVTTIVEAHPAVGPGRIDDDRYFLPVRIPFYARSAT